jgi:aconitate hydratase
MTSVGKDSLKTQRTLAVGNRNYEYFSLPVAEQKLGDISRLPISLKILLENILRLEDGRAYTVEHAQAIAGWPKKRTSTQEVAFSCGRSHPFG